MTAGFGPTHSKNAHRSRTPHRNPRRHSFPALTTAIMVVVTHTAARYTSHGGRVCPEKNEAPLGDPGLTKEAPGGHFNNQV
jgi:hypothetical protein